eukprot:6483090-Amphidinium_carterae.2
MPRVRMHKKRARNVEGAAALLETRRSQEGAGTGLPESPEELELRTATHIEPNLGTASMMGDRLMEAAGFDPLDMRVLVKVLHARNGAHARSSRKSGCSARRSLQKTMADRMIQAIWTTLFTVVGALQVKVWRHQIILIPSYLVVVAVAASLSSSSLSSSWW